MSHHFAQQISLLLGSRLAVAYRCKRCYNNFIMQLLLHSPVCATCAKEASACSCSAPDHGQELVTLLADAKEPCSLDEGMALWAMHLDVHPMTCAFSAKDFLTQLIYIKA